VDDSGLEEGGVDEDCCDEDGVVELEIIRDWVGTNWETGVVDDDDDDDDARGVRELVGTAPLLVLEVESVESLDKDVSVLVSL
jgi:hypothetical protein